MSNSYKSADIWDDSEWTVSEDYNQSLSLNKIYSTKSHSNVLLMNKGDAFSAIELQCRKIAPRGQSMKLAKVRDIQKWMYNSEDIPKPAPVIFSSSKKTGEGFTNFMERRKKSTFRASAFMKEKSSSGGQKSWKERWRMSQMIASPKILQNMFEDSSDSISNE